MKTTLNLFNTPPYKKHKLLMLTTCAVGSAFLFASPEASAVKAGEMKESVDYVTLLLNNNIVPLILVAGVVGGTALAFIKSTFSPLIISLVTAVGYGFANKWLSTVYALCV